MQRRLLTLLARAALVIGSPILLFLILELGAWSLGVQPLANNPNYQNRAKIGRCRWDPSALEQVCRAEQYKAPGKRTVFALGGSSMINLHRIDHHHRITSFLQASLNRSRPDEYRVWNLGRPCKDSFFVRRCAARMMAADPDVFVIYSGHNDFSGFMSRSPRLAMWIGEHGWWLIQLQDRLSRSRAYSLVSRRPARPILRGNDPRWSLTPSQIAHANEVILDAYSDNLIRLIELARAKGATVVLVTVVGNLHEFPVKRIRWHHALKRAAQTDVTDDAWLGFYTEGIRSFRSGRFEESLESMKRARDADPRTRAPSMLNVRIREIAASYAGVRLVDFEAMLDAEGMEVGLGCNFFGNDHYCDGVHPNARTNRLMGEAIASAILEGS